MRGIWVLAVFLAGCGVTGEVWDTRPVSRTDVFKIDYKTLADCAYGQISARGDYQISRADEKSGTSRITSAISGTTNWTLTLKDVPYSRRFDRRENSFAIFDTPAQTAAQLLARGDEPPSLSQQGAAPTAQATFISSNSGSAATVAENVVWNTVLQCMAKLPAK